MILNSGLRTDIPSFYSEWFFNRIKSGFVLVRNPYAENSVLRYEINPRVVDVLCFCTKNPQKIIPRMEEISAYRQFWFVTITPYENDVEENVPHFLEVAESFKKISRIVGRKKIHWRYDPIFVSEKYSVDFHVKFFERMAEELSPFTEACVFSFIDLYPKVLRNFPGVREVSAEEKKILAENFVRIAEKNSIRLKSCCENFSFSGIDSSGCMTKTVLENSAEKKLVLPKSTFRKNCRCFLGADMGEYNSCGNFCRYCYANADKNLVKKNMARHDPFSPVLIGQISECDRIRAVEQKSFADENLWLF
jgi:hypothetical protein